MRDRKCIR
jgi:hypothetical protein